MSKEENVEISDDIISEIVEEVKSKEVEVYKEEYESGTIAQLV